MPDNVNNANLNRLLIDLGRSFLQYVGQCWPWTDVDAHAERETINLLVARQQAHIASLTDLLDRRDEFVEFGSFPTEYTDLHYLALDHLLSQLVASEQALVAEIEGALESLKEDQEAAALLERMLAGERENLKQLQNLAASRTPAQ